MVKISQTHWKVGLELEREAAMGISVAAKATMKAECGDRRTKGPKRELELEKLQLRRNWYRRERPTSYL